MLNKNNKQNKRDIFKKLADFIERLQAQRANNMSYYLNEDIKVFIEKLKVEVPRTKIMFVNAQEDEQTSNLHAALELCRKSVEDCAIHNQAAQDALAEHENGEDTEFDPFKMEMEADEMADNVKNLLANMQKAISIRNAL